jgi:lipoprotein LpqH
MRPAFLAAVSGAALIAAGLAGCGEDHSQHSPPASAKVVVEGQEQDVPEQVVCTTTDDTVKIALGDERSPAGIGAVLTTADPPEVDSVGLGIVDGVTLGYGKDMGAPTGVNQSSAEATKDGDTYKITGTAMGFDTANPVEPVYKGFEMEVTCP